MAEMGQAEQIQPENALHRVARIPLVHSGFQIISFAYRDIKNANPLVGYFFDASERGVKAAGQIAASSLAPVLHMMGPQRGAGIEILPFREVTLVNHTALWMVDELEVRAPVLDRPADEVMTEFTQSMAGSLRGLKNQALNRLQNGMDSAWALVKDTRDAASLAAITIGGLGVRELITLSSELAVSGAENLVDRYLPEEGDGERESVGSEEMEDARSTALGLVFKTSCLLSSIVSRLMSRLNPYLGTVLGLLHEGISFILGLPYKMKERFPKVMGGLFFPNKSEENLKCEAETRKSKCDATPKLIGERTFSEPKPYGHYHGLIAGRASINTRRRSSEASEEQLQTRCRRQSLDISRAACPQD